MRVPASCRPSARSAPRRGSPRTTRAQYSNWAWASWPPLESENPRRIGALEDDTVACDAACHEAIKRGAGAYDGARRTAGDSIDDRLPGWSTDDRLERHRRPERGGRRRSRGVARARLVIRVVPHRGG